jgi:hypothetical protein
MPYMSAAWSNFSNLRLGAYIDKIKARYAIVAGVELPSTAQELVARYQFDRPVKDAPNMLIGEQSVLRYLLRWKEEERDTRVVFDFEQPLEGWESTGQAFEKSPTPVRPNWQNAIVGAVGERVANSYHPDLRDAARGTLTSPPFVIDRPRMGLRVGGGGKQTRVELRIDGRVERTAATIFGFSEAMIKYVWDVSQFQGRRAQIVLVDQDAGSWGHLTCDHVVLFSPP